METTRGSISTFIQNTTLHGVKYVEHENYSKPRRAIWVVLLIGLTAFFLFNIISLGQKYQDNDSYYSVKKTQETKLLYPAISVCGPYSFKKTAMQKVSPVLYNFLMDPKIFTSDPSNRGQMANVYMMEEIISHSFSVNDTFVTCGIGRQGFRNCEKYIHRIFLDDGLCYTFNSGNTASRLIATSSGVIQSITLVLDINLFKGLYPVHNSDIFKIVIHEPDTFPNFDGDFIIASPGSTVQVGIEKVVMQNLGAPFSEKCNTDVHHITEGQKQLMDFNQVPYSQGLCRQECRMNKIVFQDKCKLLSLDSSRCSLDNWATLGEEGYNNIQSGNISVAEMCSHCIPNCTTVTYKRDITAGSYPSQDYVATLQMHRPQYNTMDLIKANIAEVRVFFKSLEVTYSDQKPAVPPADLYSNVGGLLGLCVGASAVTIFEFCDFAAAWIVAKLWHRKRITNSDVNPFHTYPLAVRE